MRSLFVTFLLAGVVAIAPVRGQSTAPSPVTDFSGWLHSLSPEDRRKSGVDKLSAEEIAHLATLVARRSTDDVEQIVEQKVQQEVDKRVQAKVEQRAAQSPAVREAFTEDLIESRIVGEFDGWSGRTRFILENGQIWQQRQDDFIYMRITNPKVRVTRGFFGYRLSVEGVTRDVGVVRIK